jgi:predicted type IV restriction endonuclease
MDHLETTIKQVINQVTEYRTNYTTNEQAVRTQLIEPILDSLGWKVYDPRFVRPNSPDSDGKIPDYTLIKNGKTTLIVEAKNLSIDLQDKRIIGQLADYCFRAGIDFGILTNGIKWLLFKTFEKNPDDRVIWQIDLLDDANIKAYAHLASLSYDGIDTLNTLLRNSRILETLWDKLIKDEDDLTSLIAGAFIDRVKKVQPEFSADNLDMPSFISVKISGLLSQRPVMETKVTKPSAPLRAFNGKTKVREKISVLFPDKTLIYDLNVANTFVSTLQKIGLDKVEPLGFKHSGIPLVSRSKDAFYKQRQVGSHWVMIHMATADKLAILHKINDKLNLKLKIDTFRSTNGE